MNMIDIGKSKEYLAAFRTQFPGEHWNQERYKWVAVKQFQDNWDIGASDLSEMLEAALSKTENLLTSANSFPRGMMVNFAQAAPDKVRAMFKDLFDEAQDVVDRIERFKERAEQLRTRYMPGAKNHYQSENTVTTYLWLRYPDKYYIYKLGEVREVGKKLKSDLVFKKGRYEENLRNFYTLYNSIHDLLIEDSELRSILDECLDAECYHDPQMRTLTIDFGFWLSRYAQSDEIEGVIFDNFATPLSKEEWANLLTDASVFNDKGLSLIESMMTLGGEATCKQLANVFGNSANYYLSNATSLAKRVQQQTECDIPESEQWWPILFIGRPAMKDEDGSFVWIVRPELASAFQEYEASREQNSTPLEYDANRSCWWLNASPRIWSFDETPIGETQSYTLLNENGNKRRVYQNFLDVKPGDLIIGYESNPVKKIVALAEIVTGNDGEKITFKKTETLAEPIDFQSFKDIPELQSMEFLVNPNGSLFKVAEEEQAVLMDLIRDQNPLVSEEAAEAYDDARFMSEVFMGEAELSALKAALKKKKNIILQGAPGTGKTFAAKRLAFAMMGKTSEDRVEVVQFHQNYAYEDFVMGYKPTEEGFELKDGIFYRFCKKAESRPNEDFFFIIDEINRANLSKVFGELLMLIEDDHRGETVTLSYSGMPFSVPPNLYIIGMMNTADRSLALIDYALRRRFAFFEHRPAFDSAGFAKMLADKDSEMLVDLVDAIKALNREIENDPSLGRGFCIGHSYFCDLGSASEDELRAIIDLELLPMLEEYWFDDDAKVLKWDRTLHGVFA